jgi:undecaprenyl-phosphate 4-deoxy-4-formamido-L-arabinose transferase
MRLSFVIPCYKSEKTIEIVVKEILDTIATRKIEEYEIILVNDCSPDDVWSVIKRLSKENDNIRGISLSKNFGQHSALLAGYTYCSGDYIISLDDDGQTPLDSLFQLIDKLETGYDVVYAYYDEIKQNTFRKFGTIVAKKMGEVMLGLPKDFHGSSFYVARKYIIDEIIKCKNPYPYVLGLVFRSTRNVACLPAHHRSRLEGRSGYTFSKLFSLWLNGFTAFSIKPLRMSSLLGTIIACIGFFYAIITLLKKLSNPSMPVGYSSMVCFLLFFNGIIMILLGLIGEYIGRIYININNAPQYIINKTENISLKQADEKK